VQALWQCASTLLFKEQCEKIIIRRYRVLLCFIVLQPPHDNSGNVSDPAIFADGRAGPASKHLAPYASGLSPTRQRISQFIIFSIVCSGPNQLFRPPPVRHRAYTRPSPHQFSTNKFSFSQLLSLTGTSCALYLPGKSAFPFFPKPHEIQVIHTEGARYNYFS
jgi:hypothetical protein